MQQRRRCFTRENPHAPLHAYSLRNKARLHPRGAGNNSAGDYLLAVSETSTQMGLAAGLSSWLNFNYAKCRLKSVMNLLREFQHSSPVGHITTDPKCSESTLLQNVTDLPGS